MTPEERNKYYLEVVKKGEAEPEWPRPKEELIIGSQDLDGGWTQYWAYHQESGKSSDERPPADVVASENPTPKPAILIDQPHPAVKGGEEEVLELILSKDGHAYAHTASALDALEDNISSILKIAKEKFNWEVEHFMTTDRVSSEVEKKLDSLEEGAAEEETGDSEPAESASTEVESAKSEETVEPKEESLQPEKETTDYSLPTTDKEEAVDSSQSVVDLPEAESSDPIPHVQHHVTGSQIYSSTRPSLSGSGASNRKWILIPIILLLALFGGAIYFRESLFSGLSQVTAQPTPTPPPAQPTATPTPTPTVERKEFKVRVLNGTTTSGAAAALGDKLKELGWEVTRVGNNPDQTVAKGYVKAKPKLETALQVMINDLGGGFEASAEALKESETVDLEVVIGKE